MSAYADAWQKRVFDFSVALVLFILTLPVSFIVAILVRLTSKGPVIFCQERIGQNGQPFIIYKFRSMKHQPNRPFRVCLGPTDSRLTKVGRFIRRCGFDELPQLVNVMKGEMSLVGPRPHPTEVDLQWEDEVTGYCGRRAVKPGLTGLAKVNNRGTFTPKKDLPRDLAYIRDMCLRMDVCILFRTIPIVLKRVN